MIFIHALGGAMQLHLYDPPCSCMDLALFGKKLEKFDELFHIWGSLS